jgi:phenylalanyl-tRNA synthetase beta subunit
MPNADLLKLRELKLFEIGSVFTRAKEGRGVAEHTELAIGVRLKQGGYNQKDDARLNEVKALLETVLGTTLDVTIERGVLTVNVTELLSKLPKPTAYTPFRGAAEMAYTPFSQYPFVSRDIALWAPEDTTSGSIDALIKAEAGDLLLHSNLFDEFHKDGKVSYAFRLVFQSFDRTLTDDEVGEVMERVTRVLTEKGYEVR